METFLVIIFTSMAIGFVFWLGYMWGKMTGYEEGFRNCQSIHNEIQYFIKANK